MINFGVLRYKNCDEVYRHCTHSERLFVCTELIKVELPHILP